MNRESFCSVMPGKENEANLSENTRTPEQTNVVSTIPLTSNLPDKAGSPSSLSAQSHKRPSTPFDPPALSRSLSTRKSGLDTQKLEGLDGLLEEVPTLDPILEVFFALLAQASCPTSNRSRSPDGFHKLLIICPFSNGRHSSC